LVVVVEDEVLSTDGSCSAANTKGERDIRVKVLRFLKNGPAASIYLLKHEFDLINVRGEDQ
jgi:hypothetical protein